MTACGLALFDTAIGRCGIVWGERGVVGVQIPEKDAHATRACLRRRAPEARETSPPPAVQRAVDAIVMLLRGEASDLSAVALDMEGISPFHRRVYEIARTIPPGATRSYGEVAAQLGAPGAARAVGQALGRNPFAIVVPCHRVVAASGRPGGFSANGGVTTKLRLLSIEAGRASAALAPGFDAQAAVAHLCRSDAALARVIAAVGPFGLELKRTPSLFAALTEAIVHQQLSGKAAATIYARLCASFRNASSGPGPEQILRASDDTLRGAGISRPKLLALRDLARRARDGELPTLAEAQGMQDDEIVERLTPVRGIGRWTAEMLLIFRLGRPDVLPVDDYGIRKGFAVTFRKRTLPSRGDLETHGERWRPYRTVASWYLWRAAERSNRPIEARG